MTKVKWAIPNFTAAGFKKAFVTATKRSDIHCACCEICSDWKGKESLADPFEDIYVCNVCNRTYHWSCLLRLGCYKEGTRNPSKKMKPGPALLVLASLIQRKSPDTTLLKAGN